VIGVLAANNCSDWMIPKDTTGRENTFPHQNIAFERKERKKTVSKYDLIVMPIFIQI